MTTLAKTLIGNGHRNPLDVIKDARFVGIKTVDEHWDSETTVYTLIDGSQIGFRWPDIWAIEDSGCPLPGDECDHDGGCDTCPHKS